MPTRDLIRTALMVALCAAVGYLKVFVAPFAVLPNLELVSAAVFTCGVLSGARRGALIGALSAAIYFGLNPNGVSPPPLFVAQVLSMACMGGCGGGLRRLVRRLPWAMQSLLAGACGLVLTLVYDVATNSAGYLMVREASSYVAYLVAGLSFPFPLAHALGNTLGFALVTPAVCRAVWRRSTP